MKKFKKLAAIGLAALMPLSLAACGGSSDGKTHVVFCSYGDNSELEMYKKMVDVFNDTYGEEHGIFVENSPIAVTGYESYITSMSTARKSYDVFFVDEGNFKKWANMGFMANMDTAFKAVDDIDVSDIFENTVNRLRLNIETNTSNPDDPLYGLPLDTKPSAIFYNETMFEKAGIHIISVKEEDMERWNNNEIPDLRGHYKRDFPKLTNVTVPNKGYWRSMFPYIPETQWQLPAKDEILVFNNRIAMNWDETEDLAMIFSPSTNANATQIYGTEYGMFTEWWFNYGWSVGGNCLQDLSGNGDWNFSLLDSTKNYIVMSDEGYTGVYTGMHYNKGETLEFNDKFDVPAGQKMTPQDDGTYTLNGNTVGIRSAVKEAAQSGVLGELPSVRDAFVRYLCLGASEKADIEGVGGLDISPNPITFNNRTRQNYWYSQKMAMLIDYSTYIEIFSREAIEYDFEWDVAPLPRYKEYKDPLDPVCDETVVVGKEAGLCNSKAMVVREMSNCKEAAAKFICWMSSRTGQKLRSDEGWFPNQRDLLDKIQYKGYAPKNVTIFSEALEYQGAGDWWYLPDVAWIEVWAIPLNSNVRNGTMPYTTWKSTAVSKTNAKLLEY